MSALTVICVVGALAPIIFILWMLIGSGVMPWWIALGPGIVLTLIGLGLVNKWMLQAEAAKQKSAPLHSEE